MEPEPKSNSAVKLAIAVGKSRFDKDWKNTEMTWNELKEKLSHTTKTRETLAEFKGMSKARQDSIKDVGGFVGGTLKNGRRKAESVAWRQVVTLDMDEAPNDFADYIRSVLAGKEYLVYGTHKDGPNNRRLRLVFPLSRAVTPDQYQAIARRVAADVKIDFFDDTTYQPHRLMYWPSTPSDVDYYFEAHTGAWVDADEVLARYEDWSDQTQWPESSRVFTAMKKHAEKQEDPYGKKGLIGAFCRAYPIEAAIEKFLPGVYVKCGKDRYTYAEGSTSGGAIVYDGKFLYSHHATDPVSEQLVNAFDLVRIHKFRELDDDAKPQTPTSKMPSYLKMLELARDDAGTITEITNDTLKEANADFTDLGDEGDDTTWKSKFRLTERGAFKKVPWNVKIMLTYDPRIRGCVKLDLFSHRAYLQRDLPWRSMKDSQYWTNDDDSCLRNWVSDAYNVEGKGFIDDAMKEYLVRHSYNAVKDYLLGLPKWDGKPRLETLIIDYLGAEDTEFTRTATRKALVAAVARVMEPGCKFDYVLTLVGPQGLGKSFIWKRLAGKWCSDSMSTVTGKEAMEALLGFWIIELAELAALKKTEMEIVKQFISKQDDSFRPAYGHTVEHYDRQCIFVATTNNADFIRDPTGGRRWWPINVGVQPRKLSPFDDLTDDVVEQIWAEAVVYWQLGEDLFLDSRMEAAARELQETHTEESPWAGAIREYAEKLLPENWDNIGLAERRDYAQGKHNFDIGEGTVKRDRICAAEVWCELLGGDLKNMNRGQANEINNVLRNMPEWMPSGPVRFKGYGVQRGFKRM